MCEKEIVLEHFNGISTTYDENNKKVYWKLADNLLWQIAYKIRVCEGFKNKKITKNSQLVSILFPNYKK